MVNFNKYFLIILILFISSSVFGQNRYAVHFKFKPQDTYSFNNPTEFLTEKSLDRRLRQHISLDSLDFPVSQKYLDAIKLSVDMVLYNSHWLNASIVTAYPENISDLESLPFVDKVMLVAPGNFSQSRLGSNLKGKGGLNVNFNIKSRKNSSPYDFQNQVLGIPQMHESGFKGKGITIAVFDAGFPGVNQIPAFSHLFDNEQIVGTKDFVHIGNDDVFSKNQHGTNVLSLIAANDEELLVSGAYESNYILCITEDVPTEYRIEEYNWVKAAEYADSLGVDIINSSLGYWDFDDPSMDYSISDLDGETAVITKGASVAGDKGILVVTSAGNYGTRGASSLTAPADAKGILSVGAVKADLSRAGFSSMGPTADGRIKPDVSAFGEQVWVVRSNGIVSRSNGTSFSAPQVAALAAGLWQGRPEWTKDELLENLISSSHQFEEPDNLLGFGIPDFYKAYFGEILDVVTVDREGNWKVYPNPIEGTDLFISFGSTLKGEFSLIDMQGKILKNEYLTRTDIHIPFEVNIPEIRNGVYFVQMQSGKDIQRTKLMKR
ncbi:S8 family serine peptidase [Aquiflexum sp.]|uniref:S8 family serine peptidase n=1 Tax=Aquiflexum sp. TaxID=1872584 RepID=UPI003593679D